MSMSVSWGYIHAVPMVTAMIQLGVSTVHAGMALRVTDSTVQVNSTLLSEFYKRADIKIMILYVLF